MYQVYGKIPAEQQDDVEGMGQESEVFSETGLVHHRPGVERDMDAATAAFLRSEGWDLTAVQAPLDLHDFVPVPPDGLCLFYAAIAARNVDAWMDAGRDRGRGWQMDREVERAQEAEAKAMRDLVVYELENNGQQHMADRLRRGEYPGDDELPYLAHVLGCQIQRLHWQEPARSFGAPSDTCWFSILHQVVTGEDGHQAPHWVLKETRLAPGSLYVYTEGPVVPAAAAGRGGASRLPLSASERPAKRRVTWTPVLEQEFADAVQALGGPRSATPARIRKRMRTRLSVGQIKSHLQAVRLVRAP